MALDWCNMPARPTHSFSGTFDSIPISNGLGWLASGGLDRSVKVSLAHTHKRRSHDNHPCVSPRYGT